MPKLEVKGITKVYKKGAVKALDDFTVTLIRVCMDFLVLTVQVNQHL